MGFMDDLKKLTKPYAEDEDVFAESAEEEPVRKTASRHRPSFDFSAGEEQDASPRHGFGTVGKVVNMNTPARVQVILAKPTQYDYASEIANHLLDNHAVIMNLENTDRDVSRRLVDFLSGCAFALHGAVRKIAATTYLVTPENVNIVGDESKDIAEELGSSSLTF